MGQIKIERQVDQQRLDELGCSEWGVWEKEASEFPWTYEAEETCYFINGEVVVTTDDGEEVSMGAGDLVTFPRGMSCRWLIRRPVKKHYRFS